MIIETIFSTLDGAGNPNFAPMGLVWGEEFITVRPYRNTDTSRNLLLSGYGVANMTDDVLAFVQSGLYAIVLPHFEAKVVPGVVFQGACRWREVEVIKHDGSDDRAELLCRVLHESRQRDFLGFCRGSNAVIEATILATRLTLYDRDTIVEGMRRYRGIVEKTGGETEQKAFQLIQDFIRQRGIDG